MTMYQIQAVQRPDHYFSPAIEQTLIASIITIRPNDAVDVATKYINEIAQYVTDRNQNIIQPLITYMYPGDTQCQQFMWQQFQQLGVLIEHAT